ncbi:hypothetical protein PTSG_01125 [Salpingoeca rosetta]|uniref:Protein UXT n=1 Tax=Salpingoeca rosetta (strain ATCC 50818 / BSB-021) TaxID=946362 RepID=F2U0W0_SALR5|nr:uncharacterized protein PTSG_01125 [Salpingoeca rosetta]EGD80534.1 hypothetical protein PTSG_01125 [Salpingoeca rosetta]|eukprot:XP_004997095.1 hypothetical protein PTSG_01125 [Salpingoeca rosetta]
MAEGEEAAAAEAATAAKVAELEGFVANKLHVDRSRLLKQRDEITTEMSDYHKLKDMIQTVLQEGARKELRTKVDLGHAFFCQADIPNTERIYVHVGFGFHVEFTLPEAKAFIDKRITFLERRCADTRDKLAEVNALIKLVMEALREIQRLGSLPSA